MTDETFESTELENITGADLMEQFKSGVPEVSVQAPNHIVVVINPEDNEEVQAIKQNVEFTANSIREAVATLQSLGTQSGNPRYFEAIATLLNTMNNANHSLMQVNKEKREDRQGSSTEEKLTEGTTQISANNVFMISSEALAANSSMNKEKVINNDG